MKYSDISDHPRPWYGAKSIFFDENTSLYEERIIILKAVNYDEALDKAQSNAQHYANDVETTYSGYSEVFNLFDENPTDGSEVFSTMRSSKLSVKTYLDKFVATGHEIGIIREEK